jgi:hypothetical protein
VNSNSWVYLLCVQSARWFSAVMDDGPARKLLRSDISVVSKQTWNHRDIFALRRANGHYRKISENGRSRQEQGRREWEMEIGSKAVDE